MYTMKCSLQLNKNTELANDPTRGLEERLTNVVILWLKAGRKKKKSAVRLLSLLVFFSGLFLRTRKPRAMVEKSELVRF